MNKMKQKETACFGLYALAKSSAITTFDWAEHLKINK